MAQKELTKNKNPKLKSTALSFVIIFHPRQSSLLRIVH